MVRRRLALLAAAALLLGGGRPLPASAQDRPVPVPPGAEDDLRRTAVVRAVEAVSSAVVNIATDHVRVYQGYQNIFDIMEGRLRRWQKKSQSLGSGMVVDPEGFVLTNYHVVAQGTTIHVKFRRPDGADDPADEGLEAKVVASDPRNDLALLQIEGTGPYPFVEMGSSHDLLIGEPAIAIGNPFGFSSSVTAGVISAVNRNLGAPSGAAMEGMIQTDASIDPGNSGGPLLDIHGRLVGVNTAVFREGRNIGFAIPVDRVKSVLGTLIDPVRGNQVWAGFEVENRGRGLVVDSVAAGRPAEKAGLREGDAILAFDGKAVETVYAFRLAVLRREGAGKVVLRVRRPGREAPLEIAFPLDEHPGLVRLRERVGIEAEPRLIPQEDGTSIVRFFVRGVVEGGAADRVRMKAGDFLDALAGSPLESADAAVDILRAIPPRQVVPIRVFREVRPGSWDSRDAEMGLD